MRKRSSRDLPATASYRDWLFLGPLTEWKEAMLDEGRDDSGEAIVKCGGGGGKIQGQISVMGNGADPRFIPIDMQVIRSQSFGKVLQLCSCIRLVLVYTITLEYITRKFPLSLSFLAA